MIYMWFVQLIIGLLLVSISYEFIKKAIKDDMERKKEEDYREYEWRKSHHLIP